jgi:hypothetical protein
VSGGGAWLGWVKPLYPNNAGPLFLFRPTLKWTFGYDEGKRTIFLWQCIGAALLTIFPGITYTCEVGHSQKLF